MNQMRKIIELPVLLYEDAYRVFKYGDFIDVAVYIVVYSIIGLVLLGLGKHFLDQLKHKIKEWKLLTDKDHQARLKAEKFQLDRQQFEANQKKEEAQRKQQEALERKEKEAKIRAEEQEKRKAQQVREILAVARLDYGFFLPENGYPSGPSVDHRIQLEEERIRQAEIRLITSEERTNIQNGRAADGSIFGGEMYGERMSELWAILEKTRDVATYQANKPKYVEPIKENPAKVIAFPGHKK